MAPIFAETCFLAPGSFGGRGVRHRRMSIKIPKVIAAVIERCHARPKPYKTTEASVARNPYSHEATEMKISKITPTATETHTKVRCICKAASAPRVTPTPRVKILTASITTANRFHKTRTFALAAFSSAKLFRQGVYVHWLVTLFRTALPPAKAINCLLIGVVQCKPFVPFSCFPLRVHS